MLKNTPPHPIESVLLAPLTEEVVKRLQAIRLMAFDVDGVLTDGRLWFGDQGEVFKSFHALDGHGLRLLKERSEERRVGKECRCRVWAGHERTKRQNK